MGNFIWFVFKLAVMLIFVIPLIGLGICFSIDSPAIGGGIVIFGIFIFIFSLIPFQEVNSDPTRSTLYEGSTILLAIRDQFGAELLLQGKGRIAQGRYLEVEVKLDGQDRIVWVPRVHLQVVEPGSIEKQLPEFVGVEAQYFAKWTTKVIVDVFAPQSGA